MNEERQRALDEIAMERAKDMKPAPEPVTLQSLHARLTALENRMEHVVTHKETNG